MDFSVLRLKCPAEWKEIFIAELGQMGFEMMEEVPSGIEAFLPTGKSAQIDMQSLLSRYMHIEGLSAEWAKVKTINWNKEWERNYDPVVIDSRLQILAPFHSASEEYDLTLIINPRMSFGTGHHSTTYLMASLMLELNLEGATMLDAGCGTGVLGILGEYLGAAKIDAFDISDWCIENSTENKELNNCTRINFQCGTLDEVKLAGQYDYIFANINKNILLGDMNKYNNLLRNKGELYLSGFLKDDRDEIIDIAGKHGLSPNIEKMREEWCLLGFCQNM